MFRSVFFTDRNKISDFEKVINNLSKDSVIIIREYDLNKIERENFAQKIADLAKKNKLKFFVGKDLNLAKKIKADGVHFSDFDQLPLSFLRQKRFLFSYSCHSLKSVIKARKLRPDMVFISPIFATSSHPNQRPLGIWYLAKVLSKNRNFLSIYALGGINLNNIKLLPKVGLSGFGAINFFEKGL